MKPCNWLAGPYLAAPAIVIVSSYPYCDFPHTRALVQRCQEPDNPTHDRDWLCCRTRRTMTYLHRVQVSECAKDRAGTVAMIQLTCWQGAPVLLPLLALPMYRDSAPISSPPPPLSFPSPSIFPFQSVPRTELGPGAKSHSFSLLLLDPSRLLRFSIGTIGWNKGWPGTRSTGAGDVKDVRTRSQHFPKQRGAVSTSRILCNLESGP